MSRPEALTTLLEDLLVEAPDHGIVQSAQSEAIVYTDGNEIVLSADECNVVFHKASTVRQFHEALGSPADAAVELCDLTVNPDVLTELERLFTAVDES